MTKAILRISLNTISGPCSFWVYRITEKALYGCTNDSVLVRYRRADGRSSAGQELGLATTSECRISAAQRAQIDSWVSDNGEPSVFSQRVLKKVLVNGVIEFQYQTEVRPTHVYDSGWRPHVKGTDIPNIPGLCYGAKPDYLRWFQDLGYKIVDLRLNDNRHLL